MKRMALFCTLVFASAISFGLCVVAKCLAPSINSDDIATVGLVIFSVIFVASLVLAIIECFRKSDN